MIFYFSGTGNSKWVAEEIAENLGENVKNISDIKDNCTISFYSNEVIGIVFPVYAWSYPKNIEGFLKSIKMENMYTFAIATCSEEAGYSIKHVEKILKLNSGYSIVMPSNYIVAYPTNSNTLEQYKDETKTKILSKIENAKEKIKIISENIKSRKNIFDVNIGNLAFIKSSLANKMFNKYARSTKSFSIDKELCSSCGLCERVCSSKTIKLDENKIPVWGEVCYQCMACVQRCPTKAINLGKSENKARYYIEKYLE